ncbi:hypothetical protein GcM1_224059 [Golovinomyces cichoracearum]|uniref:Zn(2)-C6 fungal-type domain-containing protein n=1 Tax=Golovinomyces cichoracearum TaxID=62708 RepID=A0A420IQJ5_9PEZI|nr:hypothetical protein GcM1_224059 [Golovinomyces cichoracearum]
MSASENRANLTNGGNDSNHSTLISHCPLTSSSCVPAGPNLLNPSQSPSVSSCVYDSDHVSRKRTLKAEELSAYINYQSSYAQNQPSNDITHATSSRSPEELREQPWKPSNLIPTSGRDTQKGNRLRKACDSCSIRKVKCDESGPPCRACAALDIPCTFHRPSRRRGPPNRHSEAIKRGQQLESLSVTSTCLSSTISPDNLANTLVSFSAQASLSSESICPHSIVELITEDYFTYIHPIYPIPHEPSFRAAFRAREDLKNPGFLALLASLMGLTVLSLPRRARNHFLTHGLKSRFPGSLRLADRCHNVAVEARGAGYLDNDLTVYHGITSCFLGLAAIYKFQWNQARLYFSEALTITKIVGASNFWIDDNQPASHPSETHTTIESHIKPPVKDFIMQEMVRRVFWILFVSIRSIPQLGAQFNDHIIYPNTRTEPYLPLPLEVDDEYIFVDHINTQPPGYLSRVTSNNLNARIYNTLTPLIRMDLICSNEKLFDWNSQKRELEKSLQDVKKVLDDTPREILFSTEPLNGVMSNYDQDYILSQYLQASSAVKQHEDKRVDSRKSLQLAVQKANIYASQVATRYQIIEKYRLIELNKRTRLKVNESSMNIEESGALVPEVEEESDVNSDPKNLNPCDEALQIKFPEELESIVKEIVNMTCVLSPVSLEAFGGIFRYKMRQLISKIISLPQLCKEPLTSTIDSYMSRFLDHLIKFERIASGPLPTGQEEGNLSEELDEFHCWADLRKLQMSYNQTV